MNISINLFFAKVILIFYLFYDLGVYFNLPLSNRFALGSKLLIGRSIMQELALDATISGQHSYKATDTMDKPTGGPFDHKWDYFKVTGNNSTKFGTGISLTYVP